MVVTGIKTKMTRHENAFRISASGLGYIFIKAAKTPWWKSTFPCALFWTHRIGEFCSRQHFVQRTENACSQITIEKGSFHSAPFPIPLCVRTHIHICYCCLDWRWLMAISFWMKMGNVSLMRAEGRRALYYTEEAAAEVRALHTHTEKAAWGKERRLLLHKTIGSINIRGWTVECHALRCSLVCVSATDGKWPNVNGAFEKKLAPYHTLCAFASLFCVLRIIGLAK